MPAASRPPRLHVILVQTRHAGNIGATARLMKNLGLSRLSLVRPTARGHLEAIRMAVGASSIIEQAQIVDTLEQALGDAARSYAVSRRPRGINKRIVSPEEAARELVAAPEMETAIVFGSEKLGLSTSQTRLCDALISIPTSPQAPSLNLAQAVAVTLYILTQALAPAREPGHAPPPSTSADRRILYERMNATLAAAGFFRTRGAQKTMADIEDLFNRASLTRGDTDLLLGMFRRLLSAVTK